VEQIQVIVYEIFNWASQIFTPSSRSFSSRFGLRIEVVSKIQIQIIVYDLIHLDIRKTSIGKGGF